MTYNIHPILVHFPIALLFIYSIIKIIPFSKWFPKASWRNIEFFLLTFGVLGAFASLASGDTAEHITRSNRELVNIHALFAGISTWLYGALLLGEVAHLFNQKEIINNPFMQNIKKLSVLLERFLCNKTFSIIIAFLAFICITLTGLLGGVMVYGLGADPLAGFVVKILGINL